MSMRSDSQSPSMRPPQPASKDKFSAGLIGLALVSTIIASTCCVLPLILVLVGVTGAWMVNLTALKPLTPYFTGLALTAIVWAGYLLYRPAPACDASEITVCDTARARTRKIFLACAAVVSLLLSFPLFAPLFY